MIRLALISFLISAMALPTLNPQSKKVTRKFFPDPEVEINTPAFQKKRGFTDYDEMMAYLNQRLTNHPDKLTLKYIGTSQKGVQIPMLTLTNPKGEENKVKVWMQGGLHGDEPASTEGVLWLIDQLLNNAEYSYLLDRLHLGIVPMANIDGYERQIRYAANGLDLNRDQVKLAAQESVFLKQAFSDFGAEVALDFHEYRPYRRDFSRMSTFGITSYYDVMFLYSGNQNVPENLRHYTNDQFVNGARGLLDEHQIRHHDYVTTTDHLGEIHFNQGSINARSSATSFALTNTISTLIEIRGVGIGKTSFTRRVYSTFLVGIAYLQEAYNNPEKLRQEIDKANQDSHEAVVTSKRQVSDTLLDVIDLDTNEKLALEVTIRDAWGSTPTLTRSRPNAYVILPEASLVIEKLTVLGLEIDTLASEKTLEVERYEISDYLQHAEKYEGVNMQEVSANTSMITKIFPRGTAIIYLAQRKSNLAIEVLEPEGSNSFVSWDVLETEAGAELPIYRYLKKDPIQGQ